MSAASELSTSDYIVHHLTNATVGQGFWTFHIDTLIVSGLIGLFAFVGMALVASKATSATPGALQNFVEYLVDIIDSQVAFDI